MDYSMYLADWTRGRCPGCQQAMYYLGAGIPGQPGTWYHDNPADRDVCPDGDGRY